MKKLLGIFFFGAAVFCVIDALVSNTLAATFTENIGTFCSWGALIAAGIYFFLLDRTAALPLQKAIKSRKALAPVALLFTLVFFVLFVIAYISAQQDMSVFKLSTVLLNSLKSAWLPLLSFLVFIFTYFYYFLPFSTAQKAFKNLIPQDLTFEDFTPVGTSQNILANETAILFKNFLIVLPLAQIKSIEKKRASFLGVALEDNIVIDLQCGKRLTLVSREYDLLQNHLETVKNS